MHTVRRGIALIYWGIVVLVLTVIVGVIGAMIAGVNLDAPGDMLVLVVLFVLCLLAGWVMTLVGKLMCLAVPGEVGATGLIYTSVAIDILGLLVAGAGFVVEVPQTASGVMNLLGILSQILFLLFLRRLSEYIERYDLAGRAMTVLWIGASLFVAVIVMAVMAAMVGPLAGLLGIVVLILALVGFVMYVNLLGSLKDALQEPVEGVSRFAGARRCPQCDEPLEPGQRVCPVCGTAVPGP